LCFKPVLIDGLFCFWAAVEWRFSMTELLTADEMAEKLKVPLSWIYSHTRQTGPGTIPRIKVGKYLRFDEAKVMEWLERQNKGSVAR